MLCHEYRCIFIHIPKTAGQSVEQVFLDLLDMSWETRGELLMYPNYDPTVGPPRLAHLRAQEYVSFGHVPPDIYASYFKFAFVRNPWSRVVSMYKYLGFSKECSFKTFVNRHLSTELWSDMYWFVRPQYEYLINDDGDMLVDYIGRTESLQSHFDEICIRLGFSPPELPHRNSSENRNSVWAIMKKHDDGCILRSKRLLRRAIHVVNTREKYADYYDEVLIRKVESLYWRDIERFNYTFASG